MVIIGGSIRERDIAECLRLVLGALYDTMCGGDHREPVHDNFIGDALFTMETENSEDRLAAALAETARLRSENERLRKLLPVPEACPKIVLGRESFCRRQKTPLIRKRTKILPEKYAVDRSRNGAKV